MAWRLEKAVEHGEVDNTVPGTTTGRIWLRGMEEPLLLALEGDCWRDLAGTRLEFTNPTPQDVGNLASLDPDQVGLVGDMTAARRVCHYPRRKEEEVRWQNALYLEWFSESNGRVLIEATHYKLRISEHAWRMDEDEEEAQKLANLQAMREFMAQMIGRRGQRNASQETDGESTEERLLKESERVSRAFGEVLEKYGEDPESERKEAFVMGWDRKLEALADREEEMNMRTPPGWNAADDAEREDPFDEGREGWKGYGESPADDFFDGEDDFSDEEPVIEKARELCLRAMDLINHEAEPGTPAYQVTSSLLEVSSKLAGGLEHLGDSTDGDEIKHALAILKRCLALINDSLNGVRALIKSEEDADHRAALDHLIEGIFSVRDDIVELRREMREEM